MLVSITAFAVNPPYTLQVKNPERSIGYFVGDIIQRSVELEVTPPYTLVHGALPVKGMMRQGIELRDIRLTETKSSDKIRYRLELSYQVFSRSNFAQKIALPQETLKFSNAGKAISATVPAWQFRVSPIAAHGEVYIEQDMSPYRGPMLVGFGYLKPLLAVSLGLVVISLFGLIYMHGDTAWFPGMGGPFAASYRNISSLSEHPESLQAGVASMHHAFRLTFGETLFPERLDQFIKKYPAFLSIKPEIDAFFDISNQVLYSESAGQQSGYMQQLLEFCARCRDCERGVA
jgi:mxaA protein